MESRFHKGWGQATLADLTAATRPVCYGVLKPGDHVDDGVPLLRIVDRQTREVIRQLPPEDSLRLARQIAAA